MHLLNECMALKKQTHNKICWKPYLLALRALHWTTPKTRPPNQTRAVAARLSHCMYAAHFMRNMIRSTPWLCHCLVWLLGLSGKNPQCAELSWRQLSIFEQDRPSPFTHVAITTEPNLAQLRGWLVTIVCFRGCVIWDTLFSQITAKLLWNKSEAGLKATPHFALHTSHFALRTPHFALRTPHSTFLTSQNHKSHSPLHTSHPTLHTSHFHPDCHGAPHPPH